MAPIQGASVWEQQLYDHVTAHGKDEGEILQAYQDLAESTDSPSVRLRRSHHPRRRAPTPSASRRPC